MGKLLIQEVDEISRSNELANRIEEQEENASLELDFIRPAYDDTQDDESLSLPPQEEDPLYDPEEDNDNLHDQGGEEGKQRFSIQGLGGTVLPPEMVAVLQSLPTDGMLSCPLCFEPITYWCQKHTFISHQHRALFVQGCMVNFTEMTVPQGSGDGDDDEVFHPVQCANCQCDIGAYESTSEVYHFYHCIFTDS